MPGDTDLDAVLAALRPELDPVTYGWAMMEGLAAAGALIDAVATVREPEGLSLVLPIDAAARHGLEFSFPSARITLRIATESRCEALALIAARALADEGIEFRFIAGSHHDHVFVPREQAADAVAALLALSGRAGG